MWTQVRAAARDELRKGAHHLKVMASGGVASPTDRIDSTQYSIEELRAVVEEAEAANRYVAAHAYTARAVEPGTEAGVRSIEHGNLLDDETIRLLREQRRLPGTDAGHVLGAEAGGDELRATRGSWDKVDAVLGEGLAALERAARGGVRIVFGSDLLGGMHRHQATSSGCGPRYSRRLEIVRSATIVAADLLEMSGQIGVVAARCACRPPCRGWRPPQGCRSARRPGGVSPGSRAGGSPGRRPALWPTVDADADGNVATCS